MKPFVLLATRAQDEVADAEYEAFCRLSGLAERDLRRVRLEAAPMPDLDLDSVSGVILGGSPFDTTAPPHLRSATQDRVEADIAALLGEVVARDLPFLGACYGIGTLGSNQGGVIDRTYAEPVGSSRIVLTAQGRSDPLLAGMPDQFDAYVGHKEACRVLPPNAVLLATSVPCPVQLFRVGSNVYATQFHPELDLDGILGRIRAYAGNGYFQPHEVDEVIERVSTVDVSAAHLILDNFVALYGRP